MISSIDVYVLTLTFLGIRSIECTLTCISRLYFGIKEQPHRPLKDALLQG